MKCTWWLDIKGTQELSCNQAVLDAADGSRDNQAEGRLSQINHLSWA